MSTQYPGGIISKTAPAPTGPYENGTAPGIWTLDQQLQYKQQGIWPTAGLTPSYIEDVFSTYVYTGSNSSQTITNGIDLSTYGGLVWTKARTTTYNHCLTDTIRGGNKQLFSNTTDPSITSSPAEISSFNTTGYTLAGGTVENVAGQNFVGWTFREQPKFFDIVTYSGNSAAGREIAHNLGSTPGCIIVKRLDSGDNWPVYHRGVSDSFMKLNTTDANAAANAKYYWGNNTIFIAPTSTVFTVATDSSINQTGGTYVAYLFAHNAGGFGLTGTDNVISCGSFTTDGSAKATINLGYEPQWLMYKPTSMAESWIMVDTMRGMGFGPNNRLKANTADAEGNYGDGTSIPTATGFNIDLSVAGGYFASKPFIYIAIRRGPMKVPTSGTSVFSPQISTQTLNGSTNFPAAGFPVDSILFDWRNAGFQWIWDDRLRGAYSYPVSTSSESSSASLFSYASMTQVLSIGNFESTSNPFVFYNFRRAPSFFDEVCDTGTGASATFNHNLTVTPEIIITKNRSNADDWGFWHKNLYPTYASSAILFLNGTGTAGAGYMGTPTSSTFSFITGNAVVNASGNTYVAYLFATCAGVSKVGSYTGNGTTQTIDCGFTGGARFVLIRRIDTSGNWYVYDTARGMTVLTDPYLLLNTTAAEVATLGSVTTVSTGFALNSAILAAINVSAGTYIFLAIA